MSNGDSGIVYRFPDRDFQLGFTSRVPEVGEVLSAKGRMWAVVEVGMGSDNRVVVNLGPVEKPTAEPEAPFSPD